VKRRASPEEKAEKHLAVDEDRAEKAKAAADRPAGTEAPEARSKPCLTFFHFSPRRKNAPGIV